VQALEANQAEFRASVVRLENAVSALSAKVDRLGEHLERLSHTVDRIGEKVERLIVDVAELKGRVSQLPTTILLIGFTLAVLAGSGILKYYVR